MKWMKRITAGLTAVCMGILCLPMDGAMPAFMPDTAIVAQAASGNCGNNLKWSYNGSDTLTISGSGKMDSHPWTSDSADVYTQEITKIVLSGTVGSICEYAFYEFNSLTEVDLGDSLREIGDDAFSGCKSLKSINIPSSVTSIGERAFSNCTKLESITIPDNSKFHLIDDYTFYGCTNLTSVTIPPNVTEIGDYAFQDCKNLTIYGEAGSYAETFAKSNSIPFKEVVYPQQRPPQLPRKRNPQAENAEKT